MTVYEKLRQPEPPIAVETEGVKYIGSKRSLVPYILRTLGEIPAKTVFDGFSGTTRVAQALANDGYSVCCNDIAVFSKIFAQCYLLNRKPVDYYLPLLGHLNNLTGLNGWFTEQYGGAPNGGSSIQKDGRKRVWQIHNTMKLDAIRPEIDRVTGDPVERSVLLTSLILAMDQVDNSVGHHAAYLKTWSARSYKTMHMTLPKFAQYSPEHAIFYGDIFKTLPNIHADVAYFDPPYGSNNAKMPPSRVRYASYYHLWTTICLNDQPELVGAAGRRRDASDRLAASEFEEFRKDSSGRYLVLDSIARLIDQTPTKYIVLSYNNRGRITPDELYELLASKGRQVAVSSIDYRRHVMAGMTWTNDWTDRTSEENQELLYTIEK
ncbi:MAG TPA: DNA adenine methylase [candidate division Zixibacteria bacterium]|nr:DNA adenine methylase [candidate division Zixibacteria bacterium]